MEETGQPPAFEDDPAAAFLAREQNELAGIAEDTLGMGLEVSRTALRFGRGRQTSILHFLLGRSCGSPDRGRYPRWRK